MENTKSDDGLMLIKKLLFSIKTKDKINPIGYVDDDSCDKHIHVDTTHPESPQRTKAIRKALKLYGFFDIMEQIGSISIRKADLMEVHDIKYIDEIFMHTRNNKPIVLPKSCSNGDLSISSIDSLESILAASASVMGGVDAICSNEYMISDTKVAKRYFSPIVKKVWCNVRPPGHHAHKDKGGGFCFMNNIVVGAKFAMSKYPHIKKVLIFDWDLHHGDGTENIIKDNPNIMYISFHRGGTGEDSFYPFTGIDTTDESCDKTSNIKNYPIGKKETIESYMAKFSDSMKLAYMFKPDLVMISAGFDSHKDDKYHELPLDYIDFHYMTKELAKLADTCADGRLISILEGGYTLGVLYRSVLVHIATLIDGYDA